MTRPYGPAREKRRRGGASVRVAVSLAVLLGVPAAGVSQTKSDAATPAKTPLAEVIVTASRHVSDEQVTQEVERALDKDPSIYTEHISVTTRKGVVRVEGVVLDVQQLIDVLRLCRKTAGSRRCVNELELHDAFAD
jgi:osmotically-inducible protein OsmY